jgi:folylpolyglutamate synthase/dihydropteroate synthase
VAGAVAAADLAEAVRRAGGAVGRDGLVVVCGSLYLVGQVMEAFGLDI